MTTTTPRSSRAAMNATASPLQHRSNRRSIATTSSDEGQEKPTTTNTTHHHHWGQNSMGFSSPTPPTPSSFAPPAAVQLSEDEDGISPTSIASSVSWSSPESSHFSFASPKATTTVRTRTSTTVNNNFTPRKSFFTSPSSSTTHTSSIRTPKQPTQTQQQYGFLSNDANPRWSRHTRMATCVFTVLVWTYGAWSLTQLQHYNSFSSIVLAPPESPSGLAQAAFAKNYPRDWGAAPSLWVVLEAALSATESQQNQHPSFTDDTSLLYFEGKNYHFGLTDHLQRQFHLNDEATPAVRVTSYYSLQNQGLDYLAKNMVTPDGSKTMLQIQYLPNELSNVNVQEEDLKQTILNYGQDNPSPWLNIHYTGVTWSGTVSSSFQWKQYVSAIVLGLVLLSMGTAFGLHQWGWEHPHTLWGTLAVASMASTISLTCILLSHLSNANANASGTTTPLALSTMVMMALVLSIYFSKIQVDSHVHYKTLGKPVILASGGVLLATFASWYTLPSPTLQSVGSAAMWTVLSSMLFHIGLVPLGWHQLPYAQSERDRVCPSPSLTKSRLMSTSSSGYSNNNNRITKSTWISLFVYACVLLPIALQSRRFGPMSLDGAAPTDLLEQGQSMGHGRLTPYRILFDGHKSNISMISLNGYDIVQLVIEELLGIALIADDGNNIASGGAEDTEDAFASEGLASLQQGSTHIGEANAEVQHLIKDFVEMLRQFKERQQEEFDHHHRRRQEQLERRQQQSQDDEYDQGQIRFDYKVNSGISATTYTGLSVLENNRIPQALYSAAKVCRDIEPRCPSEALHLLNMLEDETTTSDHLATYVTVNLGLDPFSAKGAEWLQLARETIARLQEDPRVLGGVEVHIEGYAASVEDFKAYQSKALPGKICIGIGIVLLALVISSRSILVPLRMTLALSLTMTVALGLEVLLYKDGMLNWTRLRALSQASDSQQSFSAVLLCAAIATLAVISETLCHQRPQSHGNVNESSLIAAGKTTVGSLLLLGLCCKVTLDAGSLHVPVLVSMALAVDMLFIRRLLFPCLEHLVASNKSKWTLSAGQKRGAASCISKNDDYLKKYEDFVQSPRAP